MTFRGGRMSERAPEVPSETGAHTIVVVDHFQYEATCGKGCPQNLGDPERFHFDTKRLVKCGVAAAVQDALRNPSTLAQAIQSVRAGTSASVAANCHALKIIDAIRKATS